MPHREINDLRSRRPGNCKDLRHPACGAHTTVRRADRRRSSLAGLLALGLCAFGLAAAAGAHGETFPRPAQLEPDVHFWERIYSGVTTQSGLLHDDRFLDVVYATIAFPPALSPRQRAELVDDTRGYYERILEKLASGDRTALSDDERRVLAFFPQDVGTAALHEAAGRVRFQLGQADRFREGLVRSGAWGRHVEDTLRRRGLPEELVALPHVESSFNPRAYSKVGAAGMWQFMPSTGRRWLRIDNVVDERLDPYKSTVAAAEYLALNHSILGTWPLALTAYNHGAGGMRRAKELMGTDDIVTIVRNYQSRSFGFASRNFYVSFLAALAIERDPGRFFGTVERAPRDASRVLQLPDYVPLAALERVLGTDREALRGLNASLLDPVWSGQRFVPRGFELRVPAAVSDPARALAALAPGERFAAQKRDAMHRVRRGETLARIARAHDVTVAQLLSLNGLPNARAVHAGMSLKLPGVQPVAAAAPRPAEPSGSEVTVVRSGDVLSEIARRVGTTPAALMALNSLKDANFLYEGQKLRTRPAAAAATTAVAAGAAPIAETATPEEQPEEDIRGARENARAKPQPVSAEQAAESGPALVPGVQSAASADPTDYSVSNGSAIVQGAETLGHFAEWLGVSAQRLRELNEMRAGAALTLGRRIRLDLSHVDAALFEERRTAWHRALQDEFFQRYRITGRERIRLKAGESLWTLTQRTSVPVWLLRQYNPEIDFGNVRIGTEIVLPKIESLAPHPPGAAVG